MMATALRWICEGSDTSEDVCVWMRTSSPDTDSSPNCKDPLNALTVPIEGWFHLRSLRTLHPTCDRKCSLECISERCGLSVRPSVCVGLLGFHFTACWWSWHRYGFTTLGRARSHCWQQVLFDVDVQCWVSVLASTYDLHYDQRRNACWWMTGDSGKRGERRGGRRDGG